MLDEAIEVAEAHGYKVVDESAKAYAEKSKKELIKEAIEVAKAHGYKVIKEDEEEEVETNVETETPEVEDDGELITIQVTKSELEAIKSVLDKIEYEDDGSADAEAAAAVVSAMDNDNIYGAAED
jgi:2C-methyl-D-erythritol 2,4-cyclodiphosphate synthase